MTCKEQIDEFLKDLPSKWRDKLTEILLEIEGNKNTIDCGKVKECETLTSLSEFSISGTIVSITYINEAGISITRTFNISEIINNTLSTTDPECLTTPTEWLNLSFSEKIQLLIDSHCDCCTEPTTTTTSTSSSTTSTSSTTTSTTTTALFDFYMGYDVTDCAVSCDDYSTTTTTSSTSTSSTSTTTTIEPTTTTTSTSTSSTTTTTTEEPTTTTTTTTIAYFEFCMGYDVTDCSLACDDYINCP